MIKKIGRRVLVMTIMVVASMIVATLAMIACYSLPVGRMRLHAYESSSNFTEGDHPEWANGLIPTQLDCFSDSLIMNTAIFKGTGSTVNDAMLNYYVMFPDKGVTESYVTSFDDNVYDSAYLVPYPRYWHGHLAIIKPLLLFLNSSEIMTLNMIMQFTLLIYIVVRMAGKYGNHLVTAFFFPIIILNPVTTAQSLQYSQVYYVVLLSMIALLNIQISADNPVVSYVFLFSGILTAFLDFLTFPIVALGIPLIFVLSVPETRASIWQAIRLSVAWGIGYAAMWAGKWCVGTLLTDMNVFENAASLMGTWTEKVPYWHTLDLNIWPLRDRTNKVLLLAFAAYVIVYYFIIHRAAFRIQVSRVITIALVGVYPLVWYYIMRTHSTIHYWMTFRNLAVLGYALVSIILISIDMNSRRKEMGLPWIKSQY